MQTIQNIYTNAITEDTVLWFGKHKGEKISDVLEYDVDYLNWLLTKTDFSSKFDIDEDLIHKVGG